ncbi:ankyrin repeat-containing domain protein, partial [Dactylonectria estremocensis]
SAGADVNVAAAGYDGRTALQAAAQGGHLEVVEKLLAVGADVNGAAARDVGQTALQAADGRGHLEVVENLLEHVNNESLTDDDLLKLIDATEALKGSAPFEAFITRALKRNTWKMIKNPYHRAVLAGSSNVVEALKKHGVNPTGLDEDNWSCVDYATRLGRLELLDSLREHFQQHARAEHARPEHGFPTTLLWTDFEQSVLVTSCSTSGHQECTGIHGKLALYLHTTIDSVCIRSKRCVPPPSVSNKHLYFEVTVLKDSDSRILGLGFCGEDIGRDQMPGWFDGSWAYRGDDGMLFIESGRGVAPAPDFGAPGEFGAGDVVGACLNLETGEGFCTLNGKKMNMGYASERTKFKVVKMYPCVRVDTEEEGVGLHFVVNFRASSTNPFIYTGPF